MHRHSEIARAGWVRIAAVSFGVVVLLAATIPGIGADNAPVSATALAKHAKANYELAAHWAPQKVGKLVFDTAVNPHWMDEGDKFWYTFETTKGRKFSVVDPAKTTRAYVF